MGQGSFRAQTRAQILAQGPVIWGRQVVGCGRLLSAQLGRSAVPLWVLEAAVRSGDRGRTPSVGNGATREVAIYHSS